MAQNPEKPASSGRVVSSQTLSSMIDESLFSLYKVAEAVGLGSAFKRNTWNLGTGALKEILKGVFNLKVHGRENIPATGAAITCVKTSTGAYPFLAWVAVAESKSRILHQAFDIEFFKIVGLRSALYWLDSIEIANGKVSAPEKETIKKYVAENELIGLSLEHVKQAGETEEVVPALDTIEIAKDAGIPIIPIQISNADGVVDAKTRKVSLNKKISITILPPYTRHLDKNISFKDCLRDLGELVKEKPEE
jgi:1-acyl-sn-glycerol-3-phosphate acyltransferase